MQRLPFPTALLRRAVGERGIGAACHRRPVSALPLPLSSAMPLLFSAPSAQQQQRRWCSTTPTTTTGQTGSEGETATAASSSMAAPQLPADGGSDGQYSPEIEAQIREWQERLKGLSPADQELIISSLLNPEQQAPSVMGGPGIGPKDADMVAAFTCGKCDFRMVKKFSKHAYTKGIVIIECPNCRVKHLIADNLGWITDEAKNVEDILREKGESFIRIGDGDYQVVAGTAEGKGDEEGRAAPK